MFDRVVWRDVGCRRLLYAAITRCRMSPCSASSMLVAALRPLARPAGIDDACARRALATM